MPKPGVLGCLPSLMALFLADVAASAASAASAKAEADKPAEVANRGQREAKDISYGEWQKLCFKAGGAPTLCRTSITGRFPTGQMAVRVDLIEREDSSAARLQLFVPVGMYLQQPATLTVDRGKPVRLPYSWCLTNACIAADVAPPELIKEMESGQTLVLEVVNSNLLTLATPVPLTTFTSVRAGAPASVLEQYVDE